MALLIALIAFVVAVASLVFAWRTRMMLARHILIQAAIRQSFEETLRMIVQAVATDMRAREQVSRRSRGREWDQ